MSTEQRLRQEIDEMQQQWELLSEKLSALEKDKILETRAEERLRLEHGINAVETERQQVRQQLDRLEAQLAAGTIPITQDGVIIKKRLKTPFKALLLLVLPTLIVVIFAIVLLYWRISTRVQVDLTVNRAVFIVGGDEAAAILNAPVHFQSITIEEFTSIRFGPEQLKVADPAQYIPEEDRYPGDAWRALDFTLPLVITGEDQTLQPAITLGNEDAGFDDSGVLDLIRVKPGVQVILELRSERAEDLTIQVEGKDSFATLSLPSSFQLISDYCKINGIIDFPYQDENSLTYSARLSDNRPLIEIHSQPDSLILLLSLSPEKAENLFYQGGIPAASLEFMRQGLKGEIETTLIQGVEGQISYPEYPDMKPVSFTSPDFLGLGKIEKDKFRIEEISLDREQGGIQFRLNGVAGHIRTGSPEFPEDHRLTGFDMLWHSSKLAVLFTIVVWGFSTTAAAYKLYKEFTKVHHES